MVNTIKSEFQIFSTPTLLPKQFLTISVTSASFSKSHLTLILNPLPNLFFSSPGLATDTNCPLINIPILLQRDQAQFIVWVVNIIDDCFMREERVRLFHKKRREIGSTPEEGSSKNIIFGLPNIDIDTQSLRLFPPLRAPAFTLM